MESRLKSSQARFGPLFKGSGVTTTAGTDLLDDDFRQQALPYKSRIEHLPSQHFFDLSHKLEFVVIFQTIQIERLSAQLEILRIKIKDSDRQICNYKNYEVQIKELTENCHQLEQERMQYQDQVQRMSLACNMLYGQLAEAKKKQEQLILEMKAEHDKATLQRDNDREQILKAGQKLELELKKRFDAEKQQAAMAQIQSQQIAKFKQIMTRNDQEIASLKAKEAHKGDELHRCNEELEKVKDTVEEEKDKRAYYETQIRKLLKERQGLCNQINFLGQQLEQSQVDMTEKNQDISNKDCEIRQLKYAYKVLEENIISMSEELSTEKGKSVVLSNQIKQIITVIEAKMGQIEYIKQYIGGVQKELQLRFQKDEEIGEKLSHLDNILSENQRLQQKNQILTNSLNEAEDEIFKRKLANDNLQVQIQQLEYEIKNAERSINEQNQVLQRMEDQLIEQKQHNQDQINRIVEECKRILQKEAAEKEALHFESEKLAKQLETIKAEGFVKKELLNEIKKISDCCIKQELDIKNMTIRIQNMEELLKICRGQQIKIAEIATTNQRLQEELNKSIIFGQNLLIKIKDLTQENDHLFEQSYKQHERRKSLNYEELPQPTIETTRSLSLHSAIKLPIMKNTYESTYISRFNPINPNTINPKGFREIEKIVPERSNITSESNMGWQFKPLSIRQTTSIMETDSQIKKVIEPTSHDRAKKGFGNFRDGIFTHPLIGTSDFLKKL